LIVSLDILGILFQNLVVIPSITHVNYPPPKGCELLVFASTELLLRNKHIASFA